MASERGRSTFPIAVLSSCVIMLGAEGCTPSADATTSTGGAHAPGADDAGASGGRGGPEGGAAPVAIEEDLPAWATPTVLARRLGALIWNGEPDPWVAEELNGGVTRNGAESLATRMLGDPRARAGVAAFYDWWLLFRIKETIAPDPAQAAMKLEAPALGTYLTLDTDGSFTDLLTVPFTFVNEELAARYGMEGISGSEMRRVPYPPEQPRIGLLTGAGVLSFFSSLVNPSFPAKRGWLVTDPLLCFPIIQSFLPTFELDVNQSIRQTMIDATAHPSCTPCHEILNSPGFAFIGFDSFGRWHPEPGAAPNETEGWISPTLMADAPRFRGPAELAHLLAGRDETRRCFVRQWMQFAVDRTVTVGPMPEPSDRSSIEVTLGKFANSGYRLRDLIIAVTRTNTFLRP